MNTNCRIINITFNNFYIYTYIHRNIYNISGVLSDSKKFGVPQGSVLGPTLYCMYTKPVSDIICRFNLSYHSYADYTQLHVTITKDRERNVLGNMEVCC